MAARTRRSLEQTLELLHRLRQSPREPESVATLRAVIEGEGSHAVARAAAIVAQHGLAGLAGTLVAVFPRFLERPERSDPGCTAKTGIVEALRRLEQLEPGLYRQAAAHVQMEPVFGGRVDTAVDLRGTAALALAELGGSDVLVDLAHLLADPEPPVRISAARALAAYGRESAIPLLHLKALSGDAEPRVVSDCLLSLLRLAPAGELAFVASFLAKDDTRADAAAAALGESRLAEAVPVLAGWLDAAARRGLGRGAVLALATLRREPAIDVLLKAVRQGPPTLARDALAALASIADDGPLAVRAREAAAERPELLAVLRRAFGAPD
jgi:HEAT repeat protein